MSVSNFLRGSPYDEYDFVKTDLNVNRYLDGSGVPLYPQGVTYLQGDLVLVNGSMRGNIAPLLNDTGATVNTVVAGNPLSTNQINADYILNTGTGNSQPTANTVTFQNPSGPVSQNVIITGNLTVNGTTTGSASNSGSITLVAGTSGPIANAGITANSIVLMSRTTIGVIVGELRVILNAGVGFTISSYDPAGIVVNDTSVVKYYIVSHL